VIVHAFGISKQSKIMHEVHNGPEILIGSHPGKIELLGLALQLEISSTSKNIVLGHVKTAHNHRCTQYLTRVLASAKSQ
jgi:hypothetical protein